MLQSLPPAGSWERIPLSAGFAVVSERGVLVLDDWTADHLEPAILRETFEEAARLDERLRQPEYQMPSAEELRDLLHGRGGWSVVKYMTVRGALARTEVAALRRDYATPPYHADARLLCEALNKRWNLHLRLEALEGQVRAIEESMKSLVESRIAGIARFAATY